MSSLKNSAFTTEEGIWKGSVLVTDDVTSPEPKRWVWTCDHEHPTNVEAAICSEEELHVMATKMGWPHSFGPAFTATHENGRIDISAGSWKEGGKQWYEGFIEETWSSPGGWGHDPLWKCSHKHKDASDATLCSGMEFERRHNFHDQEVIVTAQTREPIVKFYKDRDNNGSFATATTADAPESFLQAVAFELPHVLDVTYGDREFTLQEVLPQICELWAKLKGYKADHVFEERLLVIGRPHPESSMAYLNEEKRSGVIADAVAVVADIDTER